MFSVALVAQNFKERVEHFDVAKSTTDKFFCSENFATLRFFHILLCTIGIL